MNKEHNIIWNSENKPKSVYFDDIYFSNDDPVEETRYVFLEGNKIMSRFITHSSDCFIIGETGFGSGLNFLLIWLQFIIFRQEHPNHILKSLSFFSIEKYPLTQTELMKIYNMTIHDDSLEQLFQKLLIHWPTNSFESDDVKLDILFSDINGFPSYLRDKQVNIDAWFFDGFSPAKNPDMWSLELFKELHQITAKDGTFATFSAAGQVRRNLLEAGFSVKKCKGYGKKREMLVGTK